MSLCSKAHLFDKNIIDSTGCDCGESVQDFEHILYDCLLHEEKSSRLRLGLVKLGLCGNSPPSAIAFSENIDAYFLLTLLRASELPSDQKLDSI